MRTTSLQPIHRAFAFAAALMLCTLAALAALAAAPACAFADDDVLVTSKEVADKGDDALEHTDAILYRIGNDNAVDFGTLFSELDAADVDDESVEVTVTLHTTDNGFDTNDADSSLTATLTYDRSDWTNGTIQFSDHTGVVSIEISDDTSTDFTLLAEVVDGKNYFEGDIYTDTKASYDESTEDPQTGSKTYSKTNVVLLGDQVIYNNCYIAFSSCTVYGNGFSIDASEGVTSSQQFGIVQLYSANLDNVSVIGPEFSRSDFGFYQSDSYNVGTVRTSGECSITNSYVSGGHCALKVESNESTCTVADSVFIGGNWANIEVKYGELVIEGTVTTINEANSSTGNAVGLGIVVGSLEDCVGSNEYDTYLTINGTLNQYNWVSSSSDSGYLNSTYVSKAVSSASSAAVSGYVNTGVLWLDPDSMDASNLPSGYASYSVSISSLGSAYLWTPTSISDDGLDYRSSTYEWQTEAEVCYEPTYTWEYPDDIYTSAQQLTISVESGSSYKLENISSILSAKKHGNTLSIDISVENPTDVTTALSYDSSTDHLEFSEAGTYTIVYTVNDPCVYEADASRTTADTHELELSVTVQVQDTSINEPSITFTDGSTTYSSTTKTIGTDTYIMPDDDNLDTVTISGETVSYVTVDALYYTSSGNLVRCLPVFTGITIVDYTDANGTYVTYDYTYDSSTSGDPSGLEFVGKVSGSTIAYQWNGFEMCSYDSSGTKSNTSYYCEASVGLSTSNDGWTQEMTGVYEFTFEAGNGVTYNWVMGYHCEKYESCIPSGTQITLADGSTTAVENLRGDEELLVFDHETGAYTTSSIYALLNYGEADYEVTTLSFSDGSTTELIYEHGYFDLTRNKYVYINSGTLYDYIGDEFVVGDGESISTVTLEDVAVETRQTGCYSLITEYQLDYFVDGFLSMPGNLSLFSNIFEYGDDLAYDADLMAADIEEFGLFTYADFEGYISEEAFEALNVRYLKVAIGKGYITFEDILDLVEYYSDYL